MRAQGLRQFRRRGLHGEPACGSRSFLTFSPIRRPSLPSHWRIGLGRKIARRRRPRALRHIRGLAARSSTAPGSTSPSSAIVGHGRVGRAIATRLSGFGCRLLGVDPGSGNAAGRRPLRSDCSALADSDFIILGRSADAPRQRSSDRRAMRSSAMKPGALLINVGRGSVVDEAAVADALEDGTLGGYAADVFEMEDWARPDRPAGIEPRLLSHPRTLFTPHLGSAVDRVRRAIALQAADDIVESLCGRTPRHAINKPRPLVRAAQVSADSSPP